MFSLGFALDFFYPVQAPSKSSWLPPSCQVQFPTLLSHPKCFKLLSSLYLPGGERDKSQLLPELCPSGFSIIFCALLTLRNGLEPGKYRIMFIPSIKAQPFQTSQHLTAHSKTGSRNKYIPGFCYRRHNQLDHTTQKLTYFYFQAFSYSSKLSDGNKVSGNIWCLCALQCPILVLILILTGHTWFTPVQIKIN